MNEFLALALEEARAGIENDDGGPFGAVIVQEGVVISKAHNEVLRRNDPTAHAEILAIREASAILGSFDLSTCEIYSTSEPCPMCFAAIFWARIKRLVYGTTREDVAEIGFDDSLIYDVIRGEAELEQMELVKLDREGCRAVLEEWRRKPGRRMY
ncbi:nucleoside deaminase [Methanothrix harundinacea]|uniref:Guanine deaminase n=1 Tax=Methanothrix harundinacea (strain 6Ac) TaxID=1110509 RepID=G7WQC2_METH6|nr:nucleoside deaminase [Methanothrix harundinacea]AET65475.1 Guanine deaminase [Methanothrix harundinacea 6Ac]